MIDVIVADKTPTVSTTVPPTNTLVKVVKSTVLSVRNAVVAPSVVPVFPGEIEDTDAVSPVDKSIITTPIVIDGAKEKSTKEFAKNPDTAPSVTPLFIGVEAQVKGNPAIGVAQSLVILPLIKTKSEPVIVSEAAP